VIRFSRYHVFFERQPFCPYQLSLAVRSEDLRGILTSSPQLNGKFKRSHRSDGEEFYQLLTYTDDVDLNKKLAEWERSNNYNRPHGAFDGKAPYEALRSML